MSAKKKPAKRAAKRSPRNSPTVKPRGIEHVQRELKTVMASTNEVLEQMPFAEQASKILEKLDNDDFTPKEGRFVEEYPIDLNGAAAARRAGYSEATAKSIACELLAKPHIQEAITAEMVARSVRTRIDQDRVLTGIADLAFYDIADLFANDGSLKPIHEIPQRMRMAIAGVEVEELWEGRGESRERIGNLHKVKLVDRTRSLELLGRHLKLFTDKVEHSASVSLEEILTASREKK